MRLSVALLLLSALGALGGAWLIGQWAVGVVIIGCSVLLGAHALLRDPAQPTVEVGGTEEDRFRRQVVAELKDRMSA